MKPHSRGIAICNYNRASNLEKIIDAVRDTMPPDTRLVVCDDGSTDDSIKVASDKKVLLIRGENLGVGYNKNRAVFALQDCDFVCILEDDLLPTEKGWFELYEKAARLSGIHHFCRVQDKEIPETILHFQEYMNNSSLTPIYGKSPRGDLTFITKKVITKIGAFNPSFVGVGYAHGEYTERIWNAGLIPHPLKYVDIKEARDKLIQINDTIGGRWDKPKEEIDCQIKKNRQILKRLQRTEYLYHPLVLK